MSNSDPQPERELDGGHLSFDKERQAAWTPPKAGPQPTHPAPPAPHISGGHYPPAAPPYQPYGYDQRPAHERTSGLALAGFITALSSALLSLTFFFAFLGFFGAITALVLSIIGLVRDVNGKRMRGRGFAITGIIVAAVTLLLILLVIIGLIVYAAAHDGCAGTSGYCGSRDYSSTNSI